MTDKEMKAIEIVKGITEDDLLNYWEGPEEPYNAIQIILNIIEKKSKEIEELKQDRDEYKEEYIKVRNARYYNYVSKDKIKAKIEECENKIKKIRNKKLINEPEDTIVITRYAHYISVLQSLLEKE